ncbi:mannose-1-phosphate guanyltransferase [Alkaliphilus metalliredigens]|nr:mannose-1-phosphate guanyltransferase [Alkaliphilus metalliredigens]
MAGGKGTRLKPLTCNIPKPMVPILNKPTMEYTVELLRKHNIKDIAVTIAHLPTVITDYFHDGGKWDVNLSYYTEETPLGTGGSVKNAEEFIDDTFIVLSGDSLTDINIKKAIEFHKNKGSKATLILKNEQMPIEYGVVITNDNGRITRFLEKPSWGEVFSNTINTGMYILEPEVLDYFQPGENFDFSKDLFPKLLEDDIPMYGYVTEDYWCDVGALNSYTETHFDILSGKVNIGLEGHQIEDGIWVGEGTQIGSGVKITPPVYIGKNCVIHEGVKIDAYTTIGDHCNIENNTSLKRSIIWNHSTLGRNSRCRGSIVCNHVHIKEHVDLYENAVIGEGSILEGRVVVKPDIRLWPYKKVEENTVVNQNLVWGTKASKTIFGFKDICGHINIDINPEFASKLGTAFASTLEEESIVILSSDASNASQMIKNALIAGVHATGAGVINIGNVVMPVNRFAVTDLRGSGGIHVRMDYSDKKLIHIEFVDKIGANIQRNTEREIENVFNREDFKRCNVEQIKSTTNIENFNYYYINNGGRLLKNSSNIKRQNPSLIVSSKSDTIQQLATEFLESIGCDVKQDYNLKGDKRIQDYLVEMTPRIKKGKVNLAVIISEDGEDIILIDGAGRIIEQEKYDALIAMMILKEGKQKKLILPYTAPYIIEEMAHIYGVEVQRVKSNPASIMNAMLAVENGQSQGLSQYTLTYNAIWAIGGILDFLVEKNIKLEDLVDELPNFYYIKEEIPCDWKDKGRIIRQIIEENQHKSIEMFEGVKINDEKGWTLILPDSTKPLFNIYTEGSSQEYAKELSIFFSGKVKELLKNQEE